MVSLICTLSINLFVIEYIAKVRTGVSDVNACVCVYGVVDIQYAPPSPIFVQISGLIARKW